MQGQIRWKHHGGGSHGFNVFWQTLDKFPTQFSYFNDLLNTINWRSHTKNISKNPCRFKTWMGSVGAILIKLEMSFIWAFLTSPSDVLLRVTYANKPPKLVATQWPQKLHLACRVLSGMEVIEAICAMQSHCCCFILSDDPNESEYSSTWFILPCTYFQAPLRYTNYYSARVVDRNPWTWKDLG